jgi:hypothetical protein
VVAEGERDRAVEKRKVEGSKSKRRGERERELK